MYKDNNKILTSIEIPLHYVKLTHQLSFRNINLKLDNRTRGKWFIHSPKHHEENQLLLKRITLLLIILTSVCKYDIKEVHGNWSNLFFKTKVHGQKHPIDGLMQERRNSIANALELCLSCTNTLLWYIQKDTMPLSSKTDQNLPYVVSIGQILAHLWLMTADYWIRSTNTI